MRVQPPGLQIRMVVLLTVWLAGVQGHVTAFEKKGYQLEETGGYLYVGPFVHNPTFAARPDNSGLVLMRYGLHLDVQPLAWATDSYHSNIFSDRHADNPLRPSEWDNQLALAGRWEALELS